MSSVCILLFWPVRISARRMHLHPLAMGQPLWEPGAILLPGRAHGGCKRCDRPQNTSPHAAPLLCDFCHRRQHATGGGHALPQPQEYADALRLIPAPPSNRLSRLLRTSTRSIRSRQRQTVGRNTTRIGVQNNVPTKCTPFTRENTLIDDKSTSKESRYSSNLRSCFLVV